MSAVTVECSDHLSDRLLARALRDIADRLDPPVIPDVAVEEPRRRPGPQARGLRRVDSGASHLATCNRCEWRDGPHVSKGDAARAAAGHRCL